MFFAGIIGGFIFLSVFFYLQGHLLQFYYGYFQYSGTLKKIAISLYPYISNMLPVATDINEALLKLNNTVSTSFIERMIDAYLVNIDYLILCITNALVCLWLLLKKRLVFKSTELKLLFVSIAIPLFMTIAGRFPTYYTWMCYLPAVICLVYIIGKHSQSSLLSVIYGLATIAIVSLGLPKTLITADKQAYHNIESFILKQNFSDNDKIISPFMSYYFIRNITRTCYFTGVYPLSLVSDDTKYILKADEDYGSENMDIYIKQCEAKGKNVRLVDSLESPKMTLYVVE
jgi:hypothetical protein